MTESDVVGYLLERGFLDTASIVDGDVRVIDASRRNCNFRVIRESGPSYLLKKAQGRDGFTSTDREALVYELLWAGPRGQELQTFLPEICAVDRDEHLLIIQLFTDAEDVRQYHGRLARFPEWLATEVGKALATLHRVGTLAMEDADGRLLAPEPSGFSLDRPGLSLLHDFSSSSVELIQLLQSVPHVRELLEDLRGQWRNEVFIHQDARWDNVLVVKPEGRTRPTVRLIDWESAGLGDPAWDLGSFLGDYIGFWVSSIPLARDAGLKSYLDLARYPLASIQPALRACWHQYARTSGVAGPEAQELLLRSARYAGLKVMQTSIEHVQDSARCSLTAICLLQVGANMLERPATAAETLFGIPPARSSAA